MDAMSTVRRLSCKGSSHWTLNLLSSAGTLRNLCERTGGQVLLHGDISRLSISIRHPEGRAPPLQKGRDGGRRCPFTLSRLRGVRRGKQTTPDLPAILLCSPQLHPHSQREGCLLLELCGAAVSQVVGQRGEKTSKAGTAQL